ncbi:hypothetical protein HMPREF3232_00527 [Fannyhessea vaginae]|nr:hypothetical protein HMPREF3232_00527 [Fannyhessea vaginae]
MNHSSKVISYCVAYNIPATVTLYKASEQKTRPYHRLMYMIACTPT